MRTSKKLLSFFLSLVMIITSCSVGFTAFAADGNKTDKNLSYWNNATEAEDAFNALNDLVAQLLQIDAVKKLLQDNNIVNPVTESTTLSDVVEGASPLLINSIADVTKEDFLTEKYGDKYTSNKDAYDLAFAPLDNPNAKEGDWSFYKLYKFCESAKDSDNKELKDYAKDTLKKLDKLIDQCEKSMNTAEASDAAIRSLKNLTTNTITKDDLKDLAQVTDEDEISSRLGGNTYYYDYYKNLFHTIGLDSEMQSLADLYLYHVVPQGRMLVKTYIYIYLMDKSGNTLVADKLQDGSTLKITTGNLDEIKALVDRDAFCSTYLNTRANDKPLVHAQGRRPSNAIKNKMYDTYWAYEIFDKYFLSIDNYGGKATPLNNAFAASGETLFDENTYFTLLKEINKEKNLVSGDFANANELGAAMIKEMGDNASDYQVGDSGVKIADYFSDNIANTITSGTKDTYDYSKYKVPTELKVPVANAALNAQIDSIFGNAMVKGLIDNLIDIRNQNSPDNEKININIQDTLKDIWQKLYDDPAVTVFNLLPLITAVVDTVLPVILHDDIDDTSVLSSIIKQLGGKADSVEDFVLTPAILGPLLEGFTGKYIDIAKYSQAEGDTKYGIGAVHVDLNTALPAILHWLTGDKETALNLVGHYTDIKYHQAQFDDQGRYKLDDNNNVIRDEKESVAHFDNSVPRFTNIYIADQTIAGLDSKGLVQLVAGLIGGDVEKTLNNQGIYEIVQELLVFLRDSVDDYLKDVNWSKETGTSDKNLIETTVTENGEQKNVYVDENDGLNDIKVALPKVLDKVGKKFIKKYNVKSDWTYTYAGKIKTHTIGGKTETYNSRFSDFLVLAGNESNKANAVKILTSVVDLLIGNNINALLDFANDVVSDKNNKVTTELPLVYGIFSALGDFGETSVITDLFNGLFQLKRSDDATFTLEKRTSKNTIDGESATNFVGFSITSGFFLISNIRFVKGGETRGLWPFIDTLINKNNGSANYKVKNATRGTSPLLANSSKAKKSAAGTNYSKLLTSENRKAAKKLVSALDELLASTLSNTSLNGFDLDATDNLLSGVVTVFAAYFGAKNTNDLLKLVNNYLYFVVGESKATATHTGKIGNKPTSGGNVDKKKVYTSANLSNLVIQTYSLLENLIDYLFYNSDSGILKDNDPNMLLADAVYGLISPDAVAVRLSKEYSGTAKILKKEDYHNWNSFKVQATYLNDHKQSYNTKDFLKYGFKKGDKKAFYNALGESFNGVAALIGAVLATSVTQKGTQKNLYSEVVNPVLSILSKTTGAKGSVMSASAFNKAFDSKQYGKTLVDGLIMPVGYILNEIYDAPMSFILNTIKGLGGILRDSQIKGILSGVNGTLSLHLNGICNLLDKNISNLSPTYAAQLRNIFNGFEITYSKKNIAMSVINPLVQTILKKNDFKLPNINFDKLYSAKTPADVLLLIYGYAVDSLLGIDAVTTLFDSFDPGISKILKGLNAAQLLTVIVKSINVFKSPTEAYWSFAEYSHKLKNSFSYPDFITASEAKQNVKDFDNLVNNLFPLLNSLGVTDISGLDVIVRDNLYTNENITAIAKALYGGLEGNATIKSVLEALDLDLSPKGVAKYLNNKSYGRTYSSAAKTLRKAKSWKKVKTINWGFKNKTKGAETGFINGLAASLRPLNQVLSVFLCEGNLSIIKNIDVKALVKTLSTKGTSEILNDQGEQAATLNYKLKNGKFVLTIQSYNRTGSNHRTTKSELVIDINGIVKDINHLIKDVDFTIGTNGYESAVIPLLEAFMCDGIKSYKTYKRDYKKAKDNLIIDILKPIGNLVNTICAAPFDTITKILPNVAYYIDSCGLSQSVANLLAPITSKNGLLGILKKNGLDLDKLITGILGKSLGDVVSDAIGTDVKLNLKLNDLKSFNIQDIVIPLISKLLKDKLGIKLPSFTWAQLASLGTVITVKSKAKNNKGKYTTLQVKADQGKVLVAVLRYVAQTIVKNAKALKKMICNIDAIKKNKTLKAIVGGVFDNLGISTKDEVLSALFYFFNGTSTDKFFDYRNFKYKTSTFDWGKLDEDFCRKLNPMLDGLIGGLIEGGLASLVGEKLYTDDLVAKAAKGIYGAIEGVKVGNDTLTSVLAQTDIDFSTSNVASLLTNAKYGQSYPAAANAIRSAGSWKNVKAENLKFGVKDRTTFLHALTAILRPAFGVLDVLLNNASLNLFDLVTVPGSDGYTSTIVPLLEAFGVYNIKTQYQYRADTFKQYDNILLDIINPLWDKVEDVLNAPLETVMDILPNLALFFANDGLTQVIDNLLTPVTALLKALKPIVNINDVLKAANLDVQKLLRDKVGINLTKFDLYDLQGTLDGVISADKVVPLINSILPKIKIGGASLNLELPDIDWLELASCGKMVLNQPSQAACYGSRMYVKADQDTALITVLRYLVDTINYKDNYNSIVKLVNGIEGLPSSVADMIPTVLDALKGPTDDVILSLIDLLKTLGG